MLDGFQIIYEEDQKAEECIATINALSLTLTMQTVVNFKCPEYVMFGVNKQTKQLGVAACPKQEGARVFCKNGEPKNCRINFGAYRQEIVDMMPDWDLDNNNYKAKGTFSKDHTEVIFDLATAIPKAKRNRSKKDVATPSEETVETPQTISVPAPEPAGDEEQKNVATDAESM